jgi:hypothetical protein
VACRVEVDRLQAEAERIGGLLAGCRQELDRLVTAREVVADLAVAYPAVAAVSQLAQRRVVERVPPAAGAGPARGADAEAFNLRVLAVLAERGRPVRCGEVVAALGEDPLVPRHVERVRHRLKKLRAGGQVTETAPGMFTLTRAGSTAPG